jgi:hypothetical protein
MTTEARARAPESHAEPRSGLERKRASTRALDALRRAQDDARWWVRWALRQRRPRPAAQRAIDHIAATAHGVLAATAIIFAIGG